MYYVCRIVFFVPILNLFSVLESNRKETIYFNELECMHQAVELFTLNCYISVDTISILSKNIDMNLNCRHLSYFNRCCFV